MTGPGTGIWRLAVRPGSVSLRVYWIIFLLFGIALWPYSGLTLLHFLFFAVLSVGLYLSFSRQVFPLIVYLSMMLLYWVIVPVLQHRLGVGYYTWRGDIPQFGPAGFVFVIVHLLGILAGFQSRQSSMSHDPPRETKFSIIGVAFVLGLILLFVAIIGFEVITLPRTEKSAKDMQNYVRFLTSFVKLLPPTLLVYFLLESHKALSKNTRIVMFVVLASCLLIVSNPINTSRFVSLSGYLVVVLACGLRFAKPAFLAWVFAILPIYAIPMLGITSAMRSGTKAIEFTQVFQSLQTLEFSSYSIFLDALKLESFPQGNYLISHLFIIVPRSVWLRKADSIGIDVAERSGYVWHNVGLNSFVNSYADYGLVGLFMFSVLLGILAKKLNPGRAYVSFRSRHFMYGVLLTGMMPMLFRGDLSTMMLALYPAILAYETVRFITRFRLGKGSTLDDDPHRQYN